MKVNARRILLLATLAAATACGDGLMQMTSERQLTQAGETITVIKGNLQVGVAGVQLPKPIVFIVKNSGGTPLGGATGTIAVTAGGGSTSKTTFKTTSTGKISFNWTLGATGPQTVTIALTGGGVSAIATATVIPIASTLIILSGNNQTAFPGDTLLNPVRVELKDPSNNPIAGATITYEIQDGSGGGVRTSTAKTAATGRVSNFWELGWNKKPQKLMAKIAGVDSVVFDATAITTGITFAINAGNNQVGTANTALPIALSVELKKNGAALPKGKGTFVVRNGGGSLSKGAFVTNSNGRATSTWTLGAAGTQKVKVIIGAIDSLTFNATFAVTCTPLTIAVGEVVQLNASTFCVSGGASGREYVVVATNNHATNNANFTFNATNIVAATQPPNPSIIASPKGMAAINAVDAAVDDWEWNFRKREKAEFDAQPRLSNAFGYSANITAGVPSVGDKMQLNVQSGFSCTNTVMRTGIVKKVSPHLIIMADSVNPAFGEFTAAQYDSIAAEFESDVWNQVTGNFGMPSDIDGNSRVIALYTTAVNALTPANSSSYVGGFFYSRDLNATAGCAGSNQGEMFYMLAPDSAGTINGNIRGPGFVKSGTVGTLAHEFQHLINASRRVAIGAAFETVWLNEGLSHIAEELVYYGKSGKAPGQNLGYPEICTTPSGCGPYNSYMSANFGRVLQWWISPEASGPFASNDFLSTRGAIWWFLRYAADRKGGTQANFWNGLVANQETGTANLTEQLGTDVFPWFRDWAIANYTDDVNANTSLSWNWRDIASDAYLQPAFFLFVRAPSAGVALPTVISAGGGASFFKFKVNTGVTADVTITAPTSLLNSAIYRKN